MLGPNRTAWISSRWACSRWRFVPSAVERVAGDGQAHGSRLALGSGSDADGAVPHGRRRRAGRKGKGAAIGLLSVDAGATMSAVAAHAGVGRATLHRHFRTRDDLVRAIGARCIEETNEAVRSVDAVDAPPAQRLRAMFDAIVPLGDRYSFLSAETADDEVVRAGYRAQLDWTAALVEQLKEAGEIAPDEPTRWVVGQIDQLVWTAWKAVSDGYLDAPEVADLAQRTLIDGLKQRAAGRRV